MCLFWEGLARKGPAFRPLCSDPELKEGCCVAWHGVPQLSYFNHPLCLELLTEQWSIIRRVRGHLMTSGSPSDVMAL